MGLHQVLWLPLVFGSFCSAQLHGYAPSPGFPGLWPGLLFSGRSWVGPAFYCQVEISKL